MHKKLNINTLYMANTYIHMNATDYENNKRSYIDLNYVPTTSTNVEITMQIHDYFNAGDTYIFGMNGQPELYSPNGGYGARIRTNTNPNFYFEPTYGNNFEDQTFNITSNAGVGNDFTVRYDQTTVADTFTMYVDGTVYKQWGKATSLQNLSLFLFATNNNEAAQWGYQYAHPEEWVNEIKIFEGSTLVRHYVPKVQNNVVGLYEKLYGNFCAPIGECKMDFEGTAIPEIIPNPITKTNIKQIMMYNNISWPIEIEPIVLPKKYQGFKIKALEGNVDVGFGNYTLTQDLKYSLDNGETWTQWNYTSSQDSVHINVGQTLCLKGNNPNGFSYYDGNWETRNTAQFTINGNNGTVEVSGNIMSLIDDGACETTTIPCSGCFYGLFYWNGSGSARSAVKYAHKLKLPATTLTPYCYGYMFNYSLLETAPVLPATTLADHCYFGMFNDSKITTAPALPATTLATQCYLNMFSETAITTAPALPATTLAYGCYYSMFSNCKSLTTAPELPATTLADSCYYRMFYGCSSLTTAPQLPATTLGIYSYTLMFKNCTSLTTAPQILPATVLTNGEGWFSKVGVYSEMFSGCSSLTTAPILPALVLTTCCYYRMFYGCSSLNYIKCTATRIGDSNATIEWADGVSATGTFVKDSTLTWSTGTSGIPENWTVQDA